MGVASTGTFKRLAPRPLFLPKELQLWESVVEITGDATGGGVAFTHELTNQANTEQLFVACIKAHITTNDQTSQPAQLRVSGNYSLHPAGTTGPFAQGGAMIDSGSYLSHDMVTPDNPLFLGYIHNTVGNLYAEINNTDNKVYTSVVRILTCSVPFMVPAWIR